MNDPKPTNDNDPEPTWWSDWLLIAAVIVAVLAILEVGAYLGQAAAR